ncbi:MAG: type III toxin-antitoxin system ToxN/AbiQ family toxin [Clostridia bacterium]|nr:type III toxin-antitoxin system ToxN/AbiQ family toxin [Clostridia bacterium]
MPYYNFGGENIEELKLYRINELYAKYIYYQDEKVSKAFDIKNKRPFVGIILKINQINYFAPLSSPKKKHENMKNKIDFIKINSGRDGVINLNNMIPIPEECYEIKLKEEIKNDKKYGIILKYQIKWCNNNKEQIVNNARKLYNLIISEKVSLTLKNRCCDFKVLETKLNQYILNQEKSE